MTQAELERELSRTTGETRGTIRSRGFQLVEPLELEPLMIDWDALYPPQPARRVQRPAKRLKMAA